MFVRPGIDDVPVYRIDSYVEMLIVNKSSKSVRICGSDRPTWADPNLEAQRYDIIHPDSTFVLRSIRNNDGNPRDSIKTDKYALLRLDPNYHLYDYVPGFNKYQPHLLVWSVDDGKKYSMFNHENWDFAISKDTLYYDYIKNFTRFQTFTKVYLGEFRCAYTYTLTDEALEE